uniref:Uncharacterized protein n=1 Tax=Oryza meridionalis TaxID=40149 RepID=A0A0E0DWN8_9ORYZ
MDDRPIRRQVQVEESAIGDELVDQYGHFNFQAAADEPDHVPVVDLREHDDLLHEFLGVCHVEEVGALHGDDIVVPENALVDNAMTTGAKLFAAVEDSRARDASYFQTQH